METAIRPVLPVERLWSNHLTVVSLIEEGRSDEEISALTGVELVSVQTTRGVLEKTVGGRVDD